jgi:hypothetical protein
MDPLAHRVAARFLVAADDALPRGKQGIDGLGSDMAEMKRQLDNLKKSWEEIMKLPPKKAVPKMQHVLSTTLSADGVLTKKAEGLQVMIAGLRDAGEEFIKDVG